jgi:hypothetical protein
MTSHFCTLRPVIPSAAGASDGGVEEPAVCLHHPNSRVEPDWQGHVVIVLLATRKARVSPLSHDPCANCY